MARPIDADALIERVTGNGLKPITEQIFRKLIDDAPTIDAVSVLRCKDCKYAHMTYGGDCKYCDMWKDDDDFCIELYLDGDFYCAYGERKESE